MLKDRPETDAPSQCIGKYAPGAWNCKGNRCKANHIFFGYLLDKSSLLFYKYESLVQKCRLSLIYKYRPI